MSRIRANTIVNGAGTGAPNFPRGAIISGISTINAEISVGTGTSISSPATNELALGTNNTEKVRITSAGDVGIGDAAPNSNYGTNLSVHSTATDGARLKISDGTTGKGNLDGLDIISTGGVAYFINRENADMSFSTQGGERLRILSSGGITFNGDSATANALDDYEEGTWTPVLSNFTLGNGIITGQYTKIGNIVHVSYRIDAGSTTTFTGSATGISGLPFTNALASNTGYLTASNSSNNWFGFTQQYSTGTGTNYLQWITSSSNHQVGSATQPFTWGSSTIMRFNMTYRAA